MFRLQAAPPKMIQYFCRVSFYGVLQLSRSVLVAPGGFYLFNCHSISGLASTFHFYSNFRCPLLFGCNFSFLIYGCNFFIAGTKF